MFFLVKKVASKLDSAVNDHKYIFAVMLFSTGIALHTLLTDEDVEYICNEYNRILDEI